MWKRARAQLWRRTRHVGKAVASRAPTTFVTGHAPQSDQQLVDCDMVDSAYNGELTDNSFGFAEKNDPCTEASYSYTTPKGTCMALSCTTDIVQGSVTDTRMRPPTANKL